MLTAESATLYVIISTEVPLVGGVTTTRPAAVRVAIGVMLAPAGCGGVMVTVLYPLAPDETDGVT